MQFVPVQRDDGRQGRGGELQQLLEFVPGGQGEGRVLHGEDLVCVLAGDVCPGPVDR